MNTPQFVYPFIHSFTRPLGSPCTPHQNYFLWFAISDYTLGIYPGIVDTCDFWLSCIPSLLHLLIAPSCSLGNFILPTPHGQVGLFWLQGGHIWPRLDQSQFFLGIFWKKLLPFRLGTVRVWSQRCQWTWREAWENEVETDWSPDERWSDCSLRQTSWIQLMIKLTHPCPFAF